VFTIRIPPLRDRGDEVPLLAQHFLHRFAEELRKDVSGIAAQTLVLLKQYNWPGNVREFQSVIKQALLQAAGPVLLPEFLPPILHARPAAQPGETAEAADLSTLSDFVRQQIDAGTTTLYADYQALVDRHVLNLVLRHTAGNLTQAAKLLGITRATLRTKLIALGLLHEQR